MDKIDKAFLAFWTVMLLIGLSFVGLVFWTIVKLVLWVTSK